jgi:hypothetical protein
VEKGKSEKGEKLEAECFEFTLERVSASDPRRNGKLKFELRTPEKPVSRVLSLLKLRF